MPGAARVVLVTHPPRGASAFARELVELRLAACVQLVPIASVYRWRGRIKRAREILLAIKTTAARVPELEQHVRTTHPYELPELVALAPGHIERRYLAWLGAETAAPAGRARQTARRTKGRARSRR